MENKKDRLFCGNGKVINTQYGELTKISFSKTDLETLMNNLENGWVNTVLKKKKNIVEGKPTHYLEVDTWKPEKKEDTPPIADIPDEFFDDDFFNESNTDKPPF